ncbi:conserved hypothetical protein [Neospora caninum Liverpool]|uniref:Uncharacterized protein n=1 Tax=Neospora caninum (strain Liverpool) TaxID=572307 RepID=F0VCT2_NEOCL|nr:conserved hypothetical protein [Neospora caninum Liverpool]CBZ51447.1 conserved hypothetical protein [Neospora caninum Liverpool]CEL65395.1 TPA: hypothetical protein BN1204_012450 [Neospora caninum Liverpool]|eukprot:XP_003881480.1 conserved hypothetical protein [Neospora caninum Liverpool]
MVFLLAVLWPFVKTDVEGVDQSSQNSPVGVLVEHGGSENGVERSGGWTDATQGEAPGAQTLLPEPSFERVSSASALEKRQAEAGPSTQVAGVTDQNSPLVRVLLPRLRRRKSSADPYRDLLAAGLAGLHGGHPVKRKTGAVRSTSPRGRRVETVGQFAVVFAALLLVSVVSLKLATIVRVEAELEQRGGALVDAFVDAFPDRGTAASLLVRLLRELHTQGSLIARLDKAFWRAYEALPRLTQAVEKVFGALLPRQALFAVAAVSALIFTVAAYFLRLLTPQRFLPRVRTWGVFVGLMLSTAPFALLAFDLRRGVFRNKLEVILRLWTAGKNHLLLRSMSLVAFLYGPASLKQALSFFVMDVALTVSLLSTVYGSVYSRKNFEPELASVPKRPRRKSREPRPTAPLPPRK